MFRQVIPHLVNLLEEPEMDNTVREDAAKEFLKNREEFLKTAADRTKQYAIPRDEEEVDDPNCQCVCHRKQE